MTGWHALRSAAQDRALIGIGLASFSVLLFTINNAFGKWMIATIPIGQFLFMRGVVSVTLLTPFIWRGGIAPFRDAPRKPAQFVRVALSTIEIVCFYWAASYLPLADTLTFWLAAPIYVTAFSAVFLGEQVGWRRWMAVFAGFVGVLMVMRPSGASAGLPALIGMLGGTVYACGLMLTRSLRQTSDTVLLTGHILGVTIYGLFSLPFSAVMPGARECLLAALMALISVVASLFFIRALKLAPASIVAPYKNTMIVWGVLFGYLMFGEIPDAMTIAGASLVLAACFYIFLRERALGREPRAAIEPP